MKRIFTSLLAMVLVFSMIGCARDTSKQDAQAVVTQYYAALKKGDYKAATKLYTSDVDDGNEFKKISEAMDEMSTQMTSLQLNDSQTKKVNKAAESFATETVKQYVRSYQIKTKSTKVNDDKNKATIKVTVKGIGLSDFETAINDTSIMDTLAEKYTPKIEALIQSNGTEDQQKDLMVEMITELFQLYEKKMDGLDTKSHTETLTVIKKGDGRDAKWKIKKITVSNTDTNETEA